MVTVLAMCRIKRVSVKDFLQRWVLTDAKVWQAKMVFFDVSQEAFFLFLGETLL